MKVLIVADGPRDEASLPPLIEAILGRKINFEFESWVRIHHRGSGRGYDRKLRFSIGHARSRGLNGLICVVDRDKDRAGHRERDLKTTRDAERQAGRQFPIAFGVAVPHVDVWLLDDPVAVRQGLGLASDAEVINIRRAKAPKDELDKLIKPNEAEQIVDALKAIAARVDPKRSAHANETGFESFADDCRRELANLTE